MRQMFYATNNTTYRQDIEALSKKVETLAEQSHSTDAVMYNSYGKVEKVKIVLVKITH